MDKTSQNAFFENSGDEREISLTSSDHNLHHQTQLMWDGGGKSSNNSGLYDKSATSSCRRKSSSPGRSSYQHQKHNSLREVSKVSSAYDSSEAPVTSSETAKYSFSSSCSENVTVVQKHGKNSLSGKTNKTMSSLNQFSEPCLKSAALINKSVGDCSSENLWKSAPNFSSMALDQESQPDSQCDTTAQISSSISGFNHSCNSPKTLIVQNALQEQKVIPISSSTTHAFSNNIHHIQSGTEKFLNKFKTGLDVKSNTKENISSPCSSHCTVGECNPCAPGHLCSSGENIKKISGKHKNSVEQHPVSASSSLSAASKSSATILQVPKFPPPLQHQCQQPVNNFQNDVVTTGNNSGEMHSQKMLADLLHIHLLNMVAAATNGNSNISPGNVSSGFDLGVAVSLLGAASLLSGNFFPCVHHQAQGNQSSLQSTKVVQSQGTSPLRVADEKQTQTTPPVSPVIRMCETHIIDCPKTKPKTKSEEVSSDLSATFTSPSQHIGSLQKEQRKEFGCFFSSKKSFFKPKRKIEAIVANLKEQKSVVSPVSSTSANPSSSMYLTSSLVQNASVDDLKCDWIPDSSTEASDHHNNAGNCHVKPGTNVAQIEICDSVEGVENSVNEEELITVCECLPPKIEGGHCKRIDYEQQCNKIEECSESPNRMKTEVQKSKETQNTPSKVEHEHNGDCINSSKSVDNVTRGTSKTGEIDTYCNTNELCSQLLHQNVFSIHVTKSVKSDNCNTSLQCDLKTNVSEKLCSKVIGVSRKDGESSEISSDCDKFDTSSHSCCTVKSRPIPLSHYKLAPVDSEIPSNSLPESNIVHSSIVRCGDCFSSKHEKVKLCESSCEHKNLMLPFQLNSVKETTCASVSPISVSVDNDRTNIVSSNQSPELDTNISCRLQKSTLINNVQSLTNNCDLSIASEYDKNKFCAPDCSDDALSKSEIKSVGQDDSLPVSTSIKSEVLTYEKTRLNNSRIDDTSNSFLIENTVDASSSQGSEPSLRQFSDIQVEEKDCGTTVSSSHNVIASRGTKPGSPECFNLDSDSHLDDSDQVVPCVESEPEDRSPREGKVICSLVLSDLLSEVVEKTVKVLSNTSKDNETNSKESLQSTSYISHNTDLIKDTTIDTILSKNYEDGDENSTPLNVIFVPKHCEPITTESEPYSKTILSITGEVNHSAAELDRGVCERLQNLDSVSAENIKENETQGNLIKKDFMSHNLENDDGSILQLKCHSLQSAIIPVADSPKSFSTVTTIGTACSESNSAEFVISDNSIKEITETTNNITFIQNSSYLESNLQIISEICSNVEAAISEEKSRCPLNDSNTCIEDSSVNFQSDQNDFKKDTIVSSKILDEGDDCLQYNKINVDSTKNLDSLLPSDHTSSDNINLKDISESRGHMLQETSSVTKCQKIANTAANNKRKSMSNNLKLKHSKADCNNLKDIKIMQTDISNGNVVTAQKIIQDATEVLEEDSSSVSIQDILENVNQDDCLPDNINSSHTLCDTPTKSNIMSLMPEDNHISSKPVMADNTEKIHNSNDVGMVEEGEIIMKNYNNDEFSESSVPNKGNNMEKNDDKAESTGNFSKQKREKNSISLKCKLPLDRIPNFLLEKLSVPEHYQFRLDKGHRTEKGFSCDICSSIYKRAFSLKRHYLRSHISYRYLSNRDIANCAIVVGDKMAVKAVPPKKGVGHFPGLYRCHICGECFDDKIDGLRLHLINHPSNVSNADEIPASKLDGGLFHEQSIEMEENSTCTERKDNSSNQLSAETDLSVSKHLCLYCDKKFSSATVKRRHQRRVHQNPQPYKRKQQPVTDSSNLISGPVNVRKRRRKCKSRLHKCPYCEHRSATFTELSALVRHLKRSHQNIYHACVPCGERFCKKEELEFHISSGHSKNKFMPQFPHDSTAISTEACGKKINPETSSSVNFCHICPICSKMFTNYRNMCRHKQLAHRNSGTTISPVNLSPSKSRFMNLLLSSESPSTTSFSSETTTTSSSTSSSIGNSRSQSPFVNVPVHLNVEEQLPISVVSTPLSIGHPIKQKIKKFPQSSVSQTMTRSMAEISSGHTVEAEITFYNSIASNIRENLLHFLDGKLTEHVADQVDSNSKKEIIKEDFSSTSEIKHEIDVAKERTLNKPENNFSQSTQPNIRLYLSQLDISTQLAMGKNIEKATQVKENQHEDDVPLARVAEIVKENDSFHAGLKLVRNNSRVKYLVESTDHKISRQTEKCNSGNFQQQTTRSQLDSGGRSTRSTALKLRRSGLEHNSVSATSKQPNINMTDDESVSAGMFLSGEWVRPRSYICGACSQTFSDLYDIEEHKIVAHPNVWCNHYELDEDFALSQSENQRLLPSDLCRRHLQPQGALGNVPHSLQLAAETLNRLKTDLKCTKCGKVNFNTPPEFHRHLLECGGDTSWLYGAYSPGGAGGSSGSGNSRRSRKWRPFGSRRRRQQGHKAAKRNVTSTPPTKASTGKTHHRHYRRHIHQSHRRAAKEGDTIQRMIANLPPKRSTRHAVMFDAIKSRRKAAAFMVNVKHTRRAALASAAFPQNDKRPLLSRRAKISVQHTQSYVISKTVSSDANNIRRLRERSTTPVKLKHSGLNGRNHSVPPPVAEDISGRLRSRRRGSLPPENLKSPLDMEASVVDCKNKMSSDLKPKLQNVADKTTCLLKGPKHNSDLNSSVKAPNKIIKEPVSQVENNSAGEKKNNQHLTKTIGKKNSEKKVKLSKGPVMLKKGIVDSNVINKTKSQNTSYKQPKKNRNLNVEKEDTNSNQSIIKKSKGMDVRKSEAGELETIFNSGVNVQNNIKVSRMVRNQGCTTGKLLHISSVEQTSENSGTIKNEKVNHKLEIVSDKNLVEDSFKSGRKLGKMKNKENKKFHQSKLQIITKTKTGKHYNSKQLMNNIIDKISNEDTSLSKNSESSCVISNRKKDLSLKEKMEGISHDKIQSSKNAEGVTNKKKYQKKGQIKAHVKNESETFASGTSCDLKDDGVVANNVSKKILKRKISPFISSHEEILLADFPSNTEKNSQYTNSEVRERNQMMSETSSSRIDRNNKKCSLENDAESNLNPTVEPVDPNNVLIPCESEPLPEEITSCTMQSISNNQPSLSIVCNEPIQQTNGISIKTCDSDSQESALNSGMKANVLLENEVLNETSFNQQLVIYENTLNTKLKDGKEKGSLKIRKQRKMKQKISKIDENMKTEQEIRKECLDNNTADDIVLKNRSSSDEMIDSIESNSLSNNAINACIVTSAENNLSQSVSNETSDILAAMRIAMMEADINEAKNEEIKRKVETSEIPVRKKMKSDKTEVINESIERKLCHQCGKSFAYTTPFWRHIQQCKNRDKKSDFKMPTLQVEEPIVKRKTRSSRNTDLDDSIPILSPIDHTMENSTAFISEQGLVNNLTDARLSEDNVGPLDTDETFHDVQDDVILSDLLKSKINKKKNIAVRSQCHSDVLGDNSSKINESQKMTLSETDFTIGKDVPIIQITKSCKSKVLTVNENCLEKFETKMGQNQQNNMGKSDIMEKNAICSENQKTSDVVKLMPCKPKECENNDPKTGTIQDSNILCESKLSSIDQISVEYVDSKLCSTTSFTDEAKLASSSDEVLKEHSKNLNNVSASADSYASTNAAAVTNAIPVENFVSIINSDIIDIKDNFITSRECHSNNIDETHENSRISSIEVYKLLEGEQVIAQNQANSSLSKVICDSVNNADVSNNDLDVLTGLGDSKVYKSKACDEYDELTSRTINIDYNSGENNNQSSLEQFNIQKSLTKNICLNTDILKVETPSKLKKLVSKDNIDSKVVKTVCKLRKKFNNFSPMFTKTCRMKKSKIAKLTPCRKIVLGRKVNSFKSYDKYKLLSKKLHLSYQINRKKEKINKVTQNKLREKVRTQQEINSSVKPKLKEKILNQCDQNLSPVLDAEVLTYNFSNLCSESKNFEFSDSKLICLNENSEKNGMLEEIQADILSKTTEVSQNIKPSVNEKLSESIKKTSNEDSVVSDGILDKHNTPLSMNKCVDDKVINTEVSNVNFVINKTPQEMESKQYNYISLNNKSSTLPIRNKTFEVMEFSNFETAANNFSNNESNLESEITCTRDSRSRNQVICNYVEVNNPPNHISAEIQLDVDNSTFFKMTGDSQNIINKGDELNSLLTEDIISAAVAISQLKDKSREHIPILTKPLNNDNQILGFSYHSNKKSVNTNSKLLSKEAEEMISTAVAITQLSDIGNGSHCKEFNEINIEKSETTHLHCQQSLDLKPGDCNESADSEAVLEYLDKEKNKLFISADRSQRKLDDSLLITKSDVTPCVSSNFTINKFNEVSKTADCHKITAVKSGYVLLNNNRPADSMHSHKTLPQSKVTNKKLDKINKLENPAELMKGNLNTEIDINADSQTRQINDCCEINEVLGKTDHLKTPGHETVDLELSKLENIAIDVSTQEENFMALNNKTIITEKTSINSSSKNVGLPEMLRQNTEIRTTVKENNILGNKNNANNSFNIDGNVCKVAENENIDKNLLKLPEDILNKIECKNILKCLESKNKQTSKHSKIDNDQYSEIVQGNSFLSDGSSSRLVGGENKCIESMPQAHADLIGTKDMLKNGTVSGNAEYLRAENEKICESPKMLHSLKRTDPINENGKIGLEISMKSCIHEHTTSRKCDNTQNTVVQCDNSNVIVCQANSNYDNKLENYNSLMDSSLLELFTRHEMNIPITLCTPNSAEPDAKSLSDDDDIPLSLTRSINSNLQEEENRNKNPELKIKNSDECSKTLQSLNEVFSDCEEEYDIPLSLRSGNMIIYNEKRISELKSNANSKFLASPNCLIKEPTQPVVETEFSHPCNLECNQKSEEIMKSEKTHVTSTLSIKVTLPLRPTLEHTKKEIISPSAIKKNCNIKKLENVCISPKVGKHTKRISKKIATSGKNKTFKEKNGTNIKDQYLEEIISVPKEYNLQLTSKVAHHSEGEKNSNEHCEKEVLNNSSEIDITFNKSSSSQQGDDKSLSNSRPRRLAKEVALKEVRNHYLMDGEFELLVDDETISSSTLDELSFYMDKISQKSESNANSKARITSKTHSQDKNIVLLRSENTKDKKIKGKEKFRASDNVFEENNFIEKIEDVTKTENFDKIVKSPSKGCAEKNEIDISVKLKVEDDCCGSNTTSPQLCDHESIAQDKDFQNIELVKDVKKHQRKQLGLKIKQKELSSDLGEEANFSAETLENKATDNINSEIIDDVPKKNNIKDLVEQSINDCGLSTEFPVDSDLKSNAQKEFSKQCEQSKFRQNVNYNDILKYPNFGDPLILSRRERSTRCNLSYEEMYTSSDVSSDTDSHVEIPSQSPTPKTCTKRRRGNCRRNGVTGRLAKQNPENIMKSIVQDRNVNSKETTQKNEVDGFEESSPVGQKRKRKIKRKPYRIANKNLSDEDNQETKKLKKFYCFHCKKQFLSSSNFDKHMRSSSHRNRKAVIPIVGVEKNPGPNDDDKYGQIKYTRKSRKQPSVKDQSSCNSANKSAEESETEISCSQESGWEKRVAIHNSLCEILKAKSSETIVKGSLSKNYHGRKAISGTDPVTSSEDTTVTSCDAVFKVGSEDPDISNAIDAALVIEETATVASPSDGSVWPSPAATTLTGGTEEIIEPSSNHNEVNTSEIDKLWESKPQPEWHESLTEEKWDKKPGQRAAPSSRCWVNDVDWTRAPADVASGTEWSTNEGVPWDIDMHKTSQEWQVASTTEPTPWQPHQHNESNNWVDEGQWQGAPSWGHGETSSLVSIMDSVSQSLQILESRVAVDDEGQLQPSELTSHLFTTPHHQNTAPSLQELQTAMGATDEEMAMLQQLGGGSWVSGGVAETDIIDLDKQQETQNTCEVSGIELTKSSGHEKKYETMPISKEDVNKKSLLLPTVTLLNPKTPNFEKDRLLAPYETKELVCPACHRFFLGLTSLQKHVSIAHNGDTKGQSSIRKRGTTGISRKSSSVSGASTSWSGCSQQQAAVAAISASANSLPRIPCPICRELLVDDEALTKHKQEYHVGEPDLSSRSLTNAEDSSNSSMNQTTEPGSKEDAEGLKSHISTALGGLLDRALNNYLERGLKPGINQPTLSILQTLTAKRSTPLSPSPRYNAELVKQCRKELIGKQSSGSTGAERIDEPHPYSCNFCDSRFLQQSTLNRHIDHCHRNTKKETLIREDSKDNTSAGEDSDHSWRESSPVDWNMGTGAGEIGDFLCSDCGINFSTPQEVLKHRKLEHCSHPDPQASQPSSLKSNRSNRGRSWRKDLDMDGETIKAQAVAALRELGNQGRKCGGSAARKAKWGMKFPLASQLPTPGVGSPQSVGFSYPLVRKAPVDGKRFASLVEKKKRNSNKTAENIVKDVASDPKQLDVYEFADEEVKPPDLRVPAQTKLPSESVSTDSNAVQQNSLEVELPFVERCQRRERRRKSCADLPSDISDVIDDSDSSIGGRPRKMRRARGVTNRRRRRRTGRLSLDTGNVDLKNVSSTQVNNETSDEDDGAQTECKRQCPLIGEEEDKLSQSSTDIGVVKPVGPAPSPGESCKKAAARQRRAKSDLLISVFRKCKRSSAMVTPTPILDSTSISSCSDAESIVPAPL